MIRMLVHSFFERLLGGPVRGEQKSEIDDASTGVVRILIKVVPVDPNQFLRPSGVRIHLAELLERRLQGGIIMKGFPKRKGSLGKRLIPTIPLRENHSGHAKAPDQHQCKDLAINR